MDRRTNRRRRDDCRVSSWLAAAMAIILVGILVPETTRAQEVRYSIHAMTTADESDAARAAAAIRRLLDLDVDVRVEHHAPRYAVRVGIFATTAEAREVLVRVVELGYEDAWITQVVVPGPEPGTPVAGLVTDSDRPVEPGRSPDARGTQPAAGGAPPPGAPAAGTGQADPPQGTRQADPPEGTSRAGSGDASEGEEGVGRQRTSPDGAASGDQRSAGPARKQARARRVPGDAPRVDGRLDDPAWSEATFVTGFRKKGARRSFPVEDRTEVAFVYDDDALYVGARMHTDQPELIRAQKSPRDDATNADRLIVSLDTYRNRQTAYNFGVTVAGTRIDYYQPEDVFEVRDYSFDPVWEARTSVSSGGWTAEMRIPFSSLRFHGGESSVWGVNLQRVSPARPMYAFWIVVPGDEIGWASRFGDLTGLEGVQPERRLAIVPYVAAQTLYSDFASTGGDPFGASDGEVDWRYGADVLVGLAPGFSFEATFNPDFGQIEADPAVVNLTAYETFFPERRPFFLEGAQLFQGLGPTYFYSRRIGAPPRGLPTDGLLLEPTEATTILGAGKLIGRTPGGWSVGGLVAASAEERARTFDPETGTSDTVTVEPRTYFGVARVQKDLGAGSTFGALGTAVRRSLPSGDGLADVRPRQAFTGGVDFNFRFADETHEFGGFLGGSIVGGESTAIRRLQSSSTRYFQRPDADHVEIDPDLTSLRGYTAGMHLGRIEGPWHWSLSGAARSPGFEINDAGAMATADDVVSFGELGYGTPVRLGPWRRIDVSGSMTSGWNFGGIRQFNTPAASIDIVWLDRWRSHLRVAHDTSALSDDLTRGGPLMGTPGRWHTQFGVSRNFVGQIWALDGGYSTDDFGGWSYDLNSRLRMQLTDHLSLSVIPGYEGALDSRQYFDTLEGGRPETFGRRYVFATLARSTVYTRFRANLAITPTLGFELYGEPFAASGSFRRFGELGAPRSHELRLYGTDGTTIVVQEDGSRVVTDGSQEFILGNGDFDVWSFRSNVVFRWDYAAGSTIYVLWQQNRVADSEGGLGVDAGDLLRGFTAPGEDILAMKASFRIGR